MKITYGSIPADRQKACRRWFPQSAEDEAITAQISRERIGPGLRVWLEPPPSLMTPKLQPGDSFVEQFVDSGEGPPGVCTVEAIYLSNRRWIAYWSSGPECYGTTEIEKIRQETVEHRKAGAR